MITLLNRFLTNSFILAPHFKPSRAQKQLFNFRTNNLELKVDDHSFFHKVTPVPCVVRAGTRRFSCRLQHFVSPQLSCQKSIGDHIVVLQWEVSPRYSVNILSWTHVKGLLKMCAGPCSPLAALWKWQGLRFSPLQDQVKSIKIYYSYGSAVTSLKAPVISE